VHVWRQQVVPSWTNNFLDFAFCWSV
jgi:hypothetical protein